MLSFISFILVSVGCLNWFSIGILQYDFVAGIFGSQSNIFSRIIYTIVGLASIVMIVNMIKNKGNFRITAKEENSEYESYIAEKKETSKPRSRRLASATEASEEYSLDSKKNNYKTSQSDKDNDSKSDM